MCALVPTPSRILVVPVYTSAPPPPSCPGRCRECPDCGPCRGLRCALVPTPSRILAVPVYTSLPLQHSYRADQIILQSSLYLPLSPLPSHSVLCLDWPLIA